MSKYKKSYYNYYFNYNNNTVIFNTLTGQISKLEGPEIALFNCNTSAYKPESLNSEKEKELLYKSMILNCEVDERKIIEKNYLDYINNNELFLIILPTEQCNLRCIYCYEKFTKGSMTIDLQKSVISFLEKKLENYKALYISWFGGEPLLAIDVIESMSKEIIALCKEKNVTYYAGITTNGTLLNEKNFKLLLNARVYDYQITLDGCQETHDNQRVDMSGEGTFSKIYNNLLIMKSFKDNFGVILRTNIGVETEISVNSYIDKIYMDFGNDTRFKLHLVAIADLTGELKSTIDLCDTSHLFPFYNYARSKGIDFNYYKSLYKPGGMICYAANPNSFVIGSDGNIYKCTVAFEEEVNNVGKLENGKLNCINRKLCLWNNNGFETSEKCKYCKFLPICFGKFCPLEKIIHHEEPCPPFKKYIERYFKLF